MRSWVARSSGFWGGRSGSSVVTAPILSATDIHALADEVSVLKSRLALNPKASEARKQGEQASRYLGSGMEYEESRAYQMGDDVRHLNWRLMARTGQAHTKLFQEERQESWTLIVDQRQAMRFGTQTRLKVTQAARAAGLFAWWAQQAGRPLEGVAMSETVRHSPTFEGRSSFEHFMEFVSVPCPPKTGEAVRVESRLSDELLACLNRLQPGARLVILSDFADLDTAAVRLLAALSERVMVQAVLLEDPAERRLPALSGLRLQSLNGGAIQSALSAAQRQQYQAWAESYFAEKLHTLASVGVWATSLSTGASLQSLIAGLETRGGYGR